METSQILTVAVSAAAVYLCWLSDGTAAGTLVCTSTSSAEQIMIITHCSVDLQAARPCQLISPSQKQANGITSHLRSVVTHSCKRSTHCNSGQRLLMSSCDALRRAHSVKDCWKLTHLHEWGQAQAHDPKHVVFWHQWQCWLLLFAL